MRALVFLLILANLLFFAWAQGDFGGARDSDAYRVEQQLLADRIKIVARDEPPAEKAPPPAKPAEKKADEICLRLAELPLAEAVRVETLLADKLPSIKVVRTINSTNAAYWVFIPPLASQPDVERKVAELKRLGVPEFFVVQDAGPDQRAISLGIFSTREAANARLEQLRTKSVRTAKVGERNVKAATATIELRGPRSDALPALIGEALPAARPQSCPPQPAS